MLATGSVRFSAFSRYSLALACAALATGLVAADSPPNVKSVDFERHLMGVLSRSGCNTGSCHGSFQGRGGFRLSLFGYDPAKDYLALTREAGGRRLNLVEPEKSLILLKATGQTEHGGGPRFAKSSWQYQMLVQWLRDGARWQKGSGDLEAIQVKPAEVVLGKAGQKLPLRVRAKFTHGEAEDITHLCEFRTNDDAVVEANSNGQLTAVRPGDTTIVIGYRGQITTVHVLVPVAQPKGFRYPDLPEVNYIDREVFAKLRRLNIVPSGLAEDTEFLRRVTIDTIGSLPTPDEIREFVSDPDPDKRSRKIESLLTHPLHAALWATKLCDITGNNTDALEQPRETQPRRSQMWHSWFRKRLAENMPYDEIVHQVLCATSRDGRDPADWLKEVKAHDKVLQKGFDLDYADKPTLDLFWRRQQANVPLEQWGEKAAAAFLGVRLECAQCHKHPYDRWTQADYRSFANVFAKVQFGTSPEAKKLIDAENAERRQQTAGKPNNQIIQVREVFVGGKRPLLTDPDSSRPLPARALGGPLLDIDQDRDPRETLFRWLQVPENPYFGRSFANRVWGHYFGQGIVEPVDNFSLANPPSNVRLLDVLAKDFVEHGYDLRHLERAILNSRVYQLSSTTNENNQLDRKNFSHASIRPPMAEIVLDMLNAALDVTEEWGADAPAGCKAIEVGSSRMQNGNLAYTFRIFGRPSRTSACDCDRALDPALPQTLYRMTDAGLLSKLSKGRLARLLSSKLSDDQILEELFLATLSRLPNDEERAAFTTYRSDKKDRRAAFTDTLWALLNTREFILNH